jgi:hypothetical protein
MSTPGQPSEPRPRGSHRAAPKPRSVVVPVVLALAVVAAIGLAAWMLLSSDGDDTATPTTTPTATPSGSLPTAKPTKEPTKSPTKEPTKQPTKSPTTTGTGEPKPEPVPAVGVYVFNQTTVTGLAASFARVLEDEGWQVLGVDNWIGYVPENTVYYWPGDQAAAQRLSQDFPEVGRVWPASSPMPRDGLVVILASDPQK